MLGVLILSYFLIFNYLTLSPAIILGIIGSILPDFIWGFYELTRIKILGWISNRILTYFHELLHFKVSFPVGMIIQIITLLFFIFLMIGQ